MNIDDLTIGEAREIAGMFGGASAEPKPSECSHDPIPVLVCTDKRGVVFGYTTNAKADPINLTDARMCIYWSKDVGGVFGLAENGPTSSSRISAKVASVTLTGITAVFEAETAAVEAWVNAPVYGRN